MKSLRSILLLGGLLVLAAVAADKPSDAGVVHLDHDKVAAVFAKGGSLLATNNFKVMALRRDAPGEVEIHDRDTDVIYVLEGSANFVTGGEAKESRTTAPGETRAKKTPDRSSAVVKCRCFLPRLLPTIE